MLSQIMPYIPAVISDSFVLCELSFSWNKHLGSKKEGAMGTEQNMRSLWNVLKFFSIRTSILPCQFCYCQVQFKGQSHIPLCQFSTSKEQRDDSLQTELDVSSRGAPELAFSSKPLSVASKLFPQSMDFFLWIFHTINVLSTTHSR